MNCVRCQDLIDPRRVAIGRRLCLPCGEEAARQERTAWTVVPMHKSNYVLLTDRRDLPGIGNKGGLHR